MSENKKKMLSTLCAAASIFAVTGAATAQQANPSDDDEVVVEEGLDPEFAGLSGVIISRDRRLQPRAKVRVPVKMNVTGLLDEADAVGLECDLYTSATGGTNVAVGDGFAVAVRDGVSNAAFVESDKDVRHTFQGDSIALTFIVSFFPLEKAPPIELWTHGDCQLMVYKGTTSVDGIPRNCSASGFGPPYSDADIRKMISCVWPGTNPETAAVEFKRPGLENFNPQAEGAAQ